jgi:multiple sugar transport system substrate-binding protein
MRGTAVATLAIGLTASLTACEQGAEPAPTPTTSAAAPASPSPQPPAELTIGVWGSPAEVAAFDDVVTDYNSATDAARVSLTTWPDSASMQAALQTGGEVPDVFLAPRSDVPVLIEDKLVRPVDDPLNSREVDLGDGYSRQAIEAFSGEGRLQCMPYGVSPMVIYLNTDLVDFDRMAARELVVPSDEELGRWTLEEFTSAATFATRPRRGISGVHIQPTLTQLAPFILSGGGKLVDDEEAPTSLAFSEEDTRGALEASLEPLRNAAITLPPEKLAQKSALEWFKEGKLGMIAGDRSLVPRLRDVGDLRWDVMPMPVIDSQATVGDYTGLCLSSSSEAPEAAADLLAALVSDPYVATVAHTGYLVPVNQRVALSDHFLQTAKQPLHSKIFVDAVKSMHTLPAPRKWPALEAAVAPRLRELLTGGPTIDLEAVTAAIDESSQPVLGE